jgi:hypothetical protein
LLYWEVAPNLELHWAVFLLGIGIEPFLKQDVASTFNVTENKVSQARINSEKVVSRRRSSACYASPTGRCPSSARFFSSSAQLATKSLPTKFGFPNM